MQISDLLICSVIFFLNSTKKTAVMQFLLPSYQILIVCAVVYFLFAAAFFVDFCLSLVSLNYFIPYKKKYKLNSIATKTTSGGVLSNWLSFRARGGVVDVSSSNAGGKGTT